MLFFALTSIVALAVGTFMLIEPSKDVSPITKHELLDTILRHYSRDIDYMFVGYRNHCYRVFNVALHLFPSPPDDHTQELFAVAAGFHDIGIWTHQTIDYLAPSEEIARKWMSSKRDRFNETDIEIVTALIEWHHKITPYSGPHEKLVEIFRKADWIDVMNGVVNFGELDRSKIFGLYAPFPDAGFHPYLVEQTFKTLAKFESPFKVFHL